MGKDEYDTLKRASEKSTQKLGKGMSLCNNLWLCGCAVTEYSVVRALSVVFVLYQGTMVYHALCDQAHVVTPDNMDRWQFHHQDWGASHTPLLATPHDTHTGLYLVLFNTCCWGLLFSRNRLELVSVNVFTRRRWRPPWMLVMSTGFSHSDPDPICSHTCEINLPNFWRENCLQALVASDLLSITAIRSALSLVMMW